MSTVGGLVIGLGCTISAGRADDIEITSNSGQVNLDLLTGSSVHIVTGVSVTGGIAESGMVATSNPWTVNNDGTIKATAGNGLILRKGGTLNNAAGAVVEGTNSGAIFGTPGSTAHATVENRGTIKGGTEGLNVYGGGKVTNYEGAIISTTSNGNALSVSGGTERVVENSGQIISYGTSGYATGILMQSGVGSITNNATGEIHGRYNGIYASGTPTGRTFLTLINHGSITSVAGPAAELAGGGNVTNTGTIESASTGLYLGGVAAGSITNSGTIGSTGGGLAIQFAGTAERTLTLQTGSVLNGNVEGRLTQATDYLVLEGTGTESIAKFLSFDTLKMQGTDWSLTGVGSFTTSSSVTTGQLRINGTLTTPTLTIDAAAKLGGSGTVIGAVTNNGTIAAGDNGVGELSVTGSVVFKSGSILETEVNPTGPNDRLLVTGTATIEANSIVSVIAGTGAYDPLTPYTIMTATGGVTGEFLRADTNFAFLTPDLSYDANNVYLTLERNGIDFDAIGGTPNQRAAGRGVQGLDPTNPVYEAVLVLDIPGARYAFDQLSGEVHASASGVLLDDSRHVREAALGRLRDGLGGSNAHGAWVQAYGAHTELDGDGNAAGLDYNSAGVFGGVDGAPGENWQAGALVGYSRATFDVDARNSSGSADSLHLAAYGAGRWGGFGLRGGAAYAWYSIETARSVAFQGFSDRTSADYDGHTAQIFGEASYAMNVGPATFEPTAGLAYVDVRTDGFTENGGDAALTSDGASTDATFSTLGVRAKASFDLGGIVSQTSGFVGWQHVFGDTPTIDLAFAGNTPSFGIAGVPLAEDTALVQLGLDFQTGAQSKLGLAYSGQYGDGTSSQAFKAAFSMNF